jgi:molybdate/tungstate transport system substrate-binding protein
MFRGAISLLAVAVATAGLSRPSSAETVSVLHAGSLVNLMERGLAPAFGKATRDTLRGLAGGSNGLANQIKAQQRHGDVFISADPKVNDDLKGAANGDWVNWYITFAQSPLVIGYNPSSRFASELKSRPWYEVLEEPGIKIGRTDPRLDPKGALTLELLDRAQTAYKLPGLAQKVLGSPENPAQVHAEENLVDRLESGAIDVGFFYSTETADQKVASMTLPADIALSAHYSVTVLRDAPHAAGAIAFVAFLLGPQGQAIMREHGLETDKPLVSGDTRRLPAPIQSAVDAAK